MSDTTYFLILVAILVCVVIVVIYRAFSGLRQSKKGSRADKSKVPAKPKKFAQELNNEEDEVLTTPGFSLLKSNIFHRDRYED